MSRCNELFFKESGLTSSDTLAVAGSRMLHFLSFIFLRSAPHSLLSAYDQEVVEQTEGAVCPKAAQSYAATHCLGTSA